MIINLISILTIPQLKDNYSFIIKEKDNNKAIIIDPAESHSIIKCIKKNGLHIKAILLTHHHNDHTAGVKDILNYTSVNVYSPNKEIYGTTKIVNDGDLINLDFMKLKVIATPGHTNDHVVFYDSDSKILFSGDSLFRLGCGRVFEGTNKQMFSSINKINDLDNDTMVYCGHEYTLSNLRFLQSIFPLHPEFKSLKKKINLQIFNTSTSIPFNLGEEKALNPFLSNKSPHYRKFKKDNNFTDIQMFTYLRDLKNNF